MESGGGGGGEVVFDSARTCGESKADIRPREREGKEVSLFS